MTQAEWSTSTDPRAMLASVEGRASDRKLRLFACASCRRVGRWLKDQRSLAALDTAEAFADGLASPDQMAASAEAAWQAHLGLNLAPYYAALAAHFSVDKSAAFGASEGADCAYGASVNDPDDPEEEAEAQADLLRDIFGNPYLPDTLGPWSPTPVVVCLAQMIYDGREFARMPSLADTLEEAGCMNADILDHCRSQRSHVRGCWVVDLVLGKS
jgi:hypothetical protein